MSEEMRGKLLITIEGKARGWLFFVLSHEYLQTF